MDEHSQQQLSKLDNKIIVNLFLYQLVLHGHGGLQSEEQSRHSVSPSFLTRIPASNTPNNQRSEWQNKRRRKLAARGLCQTLFTTTPFGISWSVTTLIARKSHCSKESASSSVWEKRWGYMLDKVCVQSSGSNI